MKCRFIILIFTMILIFTEPIISLSAPTNDAYNSFLESSDTFDFYNLKIDDCISDFPSELNKIINIFFSELKSTFVDISSLSITMFLTIVILSISDLTSPSEGILGI